MFGISEFSKKPYEAVEKKCGECGKSAEKLKRCARCKSEWYCAVSCQKKAWPAHKNVCQIAAKTEKPVLIGEEAPFANPDFLKLYSEVFSISSTPSQAPKLTHEQLEDAQKLAAIESADSILDQGETEAYVKKLGQEFFDKYKEQAGGDSMAGKRAVQNICGWLASNPQESRSEARKRKDHVEFAWDGIGDEKWRWIR